VVMRSLVTRLFKNAVSFFLMYNLRSIDPDKFIRLWKVAAVAYFKILFGIRLKLLIFNFVNFFNLICHNVEC
jgi:hypothetical protein